LTGCAEPHALRTQIRRNACASASSLMRRVVAPTVKTMPTGPEWASTAKEMASVAVHFETSLFIVVSSIMLGSVGPFGVLSVDTKNLSATVLQVAGTMVALALPAGQFGLQMISELDKELRPRLVTPPRGIAMSKEMRADAVRQLTNDLRE